MSAIISTRILMIRPETVDKDANDCASNKRTNEQYSVVCSTCYSQCDPNMLYTNVFRRLILFFSFLCPPSRSPFFLCFFLFSFSSLCIVPSSLNKLPLSSLSSSSCLLLFVQLLFVSLHWHVHSLHRIRIPQRKYSSIRIHGQHGSRFTDRQRQRKDTATTTHLQRSE